MDLTALMIAASIPSAISGGIISFCFWRLQKKVEEQEKEREKKEEARRENEIIMIESMNAAIALGEGTLFA